MRHKAINTGMITRRGAEGGRGSVRADGGMRREGAAPSAPDGDIRREGAAPSAPVAGGGVHGAAPSRVATGADDVRLTERLVEASSIIGIQILDHLILGSPSSEDGRGFVSLRKMV